MRKQTVIFVTSLVLLAAAIAIVVHRARSPWIPYVSASSVPPPVIVRLQSSNGPLRIFPGEVGAFIVLQDGSLWRWGPAGGFNGFTRASVPEQIGTNCDWLQAWPANGECIALRTNGTLWRWGVDFAAPLVSSTPRGNFISSPEQVGSEADWVSVATGDQHSIATKKDGTLWGWGHDELGQLGNGLGLKQTNTVRFGPYRVHPIQTNLVQIGTNRDWITIGSAQGSDTIGIRADGTLWVWGQIKWFWGGHAPATFPVPTKVCHETNWVAIEGSLVFNDKGEVWYLFAAPPDGSAPATTTCRLLAANCGPGRFAFAVRSIYQLHSDGTLWAANVNFNQGQTFTFRIEDKWHRVGKRADWISLHGMGTALGLTRDGTLWIWGADQGQEGVMPLSLKIGLMQDRLMSWLGMPPANPHSPGGITPLQEAPRPLMQILPPGPNQLETPIVNR